MSNKKEVIFLREEYGEGSGKYTYPHGEKYGGECKNGKYHGQGTYTFPNGGKYVGDGRKIKNMVKENLLLEKGNLKETSMKGTGKMVNNMVKELTLQLMDQNMLENTRMGKNMVKEHSLLLMEESM